MSLPGYDNWKTTDPSLENEWDWILACEEYEDTPEYKMDLEQWLKEAREDDPERTFTEDDYRLSSDYENIIEDILREDGY
jgi:hypothetical protein